MQRLCVVETDGNPRQIDEHGLSLRHGDLPLVLLDFVQGSKRGGVAVIIAHNLPIMGLKSLIIERIPAIPGNRGNERGSHILKNLFRGRDACICESRRGLGAAGAQPYRVNGSRAAGEQLFQQIDGAVFAAVAQLRGNVFGAHERHYFAGIAPVAPERGGANAVYRSRALCASDVLIALINAGAGLCFARIEEKTHN